MFCIVHMYSTAIRPMLVTSCGWWEGCTCYDMHARRCTCGSNAVVAGNFRWGLSIHLDPVA